MHRQRGVALSGLLFWGVIIAVVAMLGIKVAPAVIDYYTILKNVKAVAASSSGRTVPEIRNAYSKYSEVDHPKTLEPSFFFKQKTAYEIVIAFSYEKRIHLFVNVSLLIEFQGSSSGRS